MLAKAAGFVLASLRGSTYGTEYASPLRSLRPCRTALVSIPRGYSLSSETSLPVTITRAGFFRNHLGTFDTHPLQPGTIGIHSIETV